MVLDLQISISLVLEVEQIALADDLNECIDLLLLLIRISLFPPSG